MSGGAPNKEAKYDRQLRLWQAHGQRALESASILVVNANATATETLKNLVLPGIGAFTLLDAKKVDGADAGNNFFLGVDSLGRNRAESACLLLNELNADVNGAAVIDVRLALDADWLSRFSLVVVANSDDPEITREIARVCWDKNIPFMSVRTYGFVGYLRIQAREHVVVETHPESILDLRLDCPFPELVAYADSFDLESLGNMEFAHVPYVVILLKCLQKWKETREKLPSTTAERNEFKAMVKALERSGVEDENFQEAQKSVFRACSATTVPGAVAAILQEAKSLPMNAETSSFWVLAAAVTRFVEEEGQLPLAGVVPDMKADTESFVRLQTLYRDRAHRDAARVAILAAGLGVGVIVPGVEEVARFCKNVRHVQVVRTSSVESEYGSVVSGGTGWEKAGEVAQLSQDLDSPIAHYLLLRGVDAFYTQHKRYPGYHAQDVESDIGLFKKTCTAMLTGLGLPVSALTDDLIHETVRAGASELHTMASFMGGVCSQEIIKLITGQYVPLNNTFVYNGVKSVGASFYL
ncbi:amyloid beta precursor protein-binding protein 1 [Chytriomyces sp. MP71]|nr:amyloid beta precursor protein-binding protein 1 [Chytriomyces sp. MP71]